MAEFTAITDCPRCGLIAVHWLDQPRRATEQQWADYRQAMADYDPSDTDETVIMNWSGQVVRRVATNPAPTPPRDEIFTVARICRDCGHRWECN